MKFITMIVLIAICGCVFHCRNSFASKSAGKPLRIVLADTGNGKSSAGSKLIVDVVSKLDPRPVHIVVNAGSNTLAQALIDYRDTHSAQELKAFVAKMIVYEN